VRSSLLIRIEDDGIIDFSHGVLGKAEACVKCHDSACEGQTLLQDSFPLP
jgi:hypothetical protein